MKDIIRRGKKWRKIFKNEKNVERYKSNGWERKKERDN